MELDVDGCKFLIIKLINLKECTMKVILASDTPVLPEESRFQVGKAESKYRFGRQWLVQIKLRLEMEEGDQPADWAIVSKILTGVSW